jgi:hypothetical protein
VIHFGSLSVVPISEDADQFVDERPDRGAIYAPSLWRVVETEPATVP